MSEDDRRKEAAERGVKFEEEEERAKKQKFIAPEDGEEENDDEEEEEEEDDEEEEEEDRGRSKGKKKKSKRSRLFMDEASEGSSEEDFDGEAEIEESDEDALTPLQREERARRMQEEKDFAQTPAEELARRVQQRYREKEVFNKGSSTKAGAATIETARLMRERPRTEDPKLFMVKCKPGDEKALILKLFNKYIRDKFKKPEPVDPNARKSRWTLPPPPGAELEIYSILAPGTTGYIYVEAMKEESVKAALRGVSGVFAGKISIVPIDEMQDVMRVELRKDIVRKDDYVRMRGPFPYRGDLAKVYAVLDGGNKLTVKLVPRIDMNTLSMDYSSKETQKIVPPAKHFNADEIRAAGGEVGRDQYQSEMMDLFQDHFFDQGLLLLDVSARQVQLLTEKPTLAELERFIPPVAANADDSTRDEAEAIARELDKVASKQKKEVYDFTVGDKVLVVTGPEAGAQGVLENVDGLRNVGLMRTAQLSIEVRLKDLAKHFVVGDHVKVMMGKNQGKTGTVVSVPSVPTHARPYVLVYTDLTSEEIQVYNSEIKVSSEVSAGLDELNGYHMHDLVMLDQNQHGVIVRINTDSVRVLVQTGEVKEVPTSAIRGKKNLDSKRASAPDMNNHPLACGDHVVVGVGPYKGAEGVIKHIYRLMLFIHCKAREQENSGIIVAKSKDCRVAGTLQGARAAPQPIPGARPNVMMRGPAFGGGGGGGPGKGPRDELVGKQVRIRRGNDKGLVGTVREGGSAGAVRVELNARNRTIIVPRDNIELVDAKPMNEMQSTYGGGYNYATSMNDPSRSYARPYTAPQSYMSSAATPAASYATPGNSTIGASVAKASDGASSTSGGPQYKKDQEVMLVDTGELVKVYEVVDRDVVVVDKKGKMKIVSASNVTNA